MRQTVPRQKRTDRYTALQKNIGLRIKWARERVEPNGAAFARLLGIDRSTLKKIEEGTRAASIFNVMEIAHRLHVTIDYILSGSLHGVDGELAASLVADHPELLEHSRRATAPDTWQRPRIPDPVEDAA